MYEVEVKVRADHSIVRPRLADFDAIPGETVRQIDSYYNAPHRNFAITDEALRIRTEESTDQTQIILTYKGPKVDATSKTREEIETVISDREEASKILTRIGFEPVATVEKVRERFSLESYTVTLDTVEPVGEFLEIETETEEIEPARQQAFEILELLDLDPSEQITTSYLELVLAAEDNW